MAKCGWEKGELKCQLEAGHTTPYHEVRDTETRRWAKVPCNEPCPTRVGWFCSLAKGHGGTHQGWTHNWIISGEEPREVWEPIKAPPPEPIEEWDLLPDASDADMRSLPTVEALDKKHG